MANKYPTTPKSVAQTRRKGAIQTRSIFVFFDLGGTLVDLRGIVASMAERLTAVHTRGPVPLALRWAVTTAEALPSAHGPRFRSEREIASEVLFELLAKRGRADARDVSPKLVRTRGRVTCERAASSPTSRSPGCATSEPRSQV